MCSGVASAATLATAFGGDYLSEFVTLPKMLVAAAFIGVLALVNFRGIKESVQLNLGLTAIELTGLVLVVRDRRGVPLRRRRRPRAARSSSSRARRCRSRSSPARRSPSSR